MILHFKQPNEITFGEMLRLLREEAELPIEYFSSIVDSDAFNAYEKGEMIPTVDIFLSIMLTIGDSNIINDNEWSQIVSLFINRIY